MLRLHRIKLTDFRGVASREVHFAEQGITLVSGPNEIGKSSLVDALDLLIDLRASSKHSRVMAAQPTGRDVGPCVEAELTLGPHRLVYRKRWLRSPLTELEIRTPTPAQESTDRAHELFNTLLAENGVDKELWRRLRVDQGAPLGQASVGGYASVPAMAGEAEQLSSVRRGPEEELFEKAKAEFERYFTEKRYQPTGDYKTAIDALAKANEAYAEAKAALAEAEHDLAGYQRTRRQLAEGADELENATARLNVLERQRKEATEAEAKQRALDTVLGEAEAIARQEADVARLSERLADNESEASTKQRELVAAEREAALAEQTLRTLATERDAAKTAARLAGEDVAWRRDQAEAEQAETILARLEAAQQRLDAAEAKLGACRVTDEVLAGIDTAHRAWEKAHDQLTANAATVAVTRLGESTVLIDGAPATNDDAPLPVLEARTVEVPGTVRVVVRPAGGEKQRRVERETLERYQDLCAKAGVADIAAAKEAERVWRAAHEERQNAETAIEAAQYDESVDESVGRLRSKLVIVRARITEYEAASTARVTTAVTTATATTPTERVPAASLPAAPPADLPAAQEAEQAASAAVEVAEDRFRQEDAKVKRLETRVSTLRVGQGAAARAVRDAADELELARKRLSELGTPLLTSELDRARTERDAAAVRVAELDPEHLSEQFDNQRRLVPELERAQNERKTNLEVLADRLTRYGQTAPEEQLALAETDQQRAQRTHDTLDRRAQAAKLLFETLTSHRQAARHQHTTPFRQRVERYAQRLFSQNVHVEIGENLTIESKTVGGVTVPFDSLSAGAREQLSLLARIACADLVGSVPLILDDVLGHSDRTRLDDVAVILSQVADRTQILLLSHEPSRFPIAGIHRVEL
jgi:DNA repair exonuclease SbcCD ATPase subunit